MKQSIVFKYAILLAMLLIFSSTGYLYSISARNKMLLLMMFSAVVYILFAVDEESVTGPYAMKTLYSYRWHILITSITAVVVYGIVLMFMKNAILASSIALMMSYMSARNRARIRDFLTTGAVFGGSLIETPIGDPHPDITAVM
jgi:hypothetical protein